MDNKALAKIKTNVLVRGLAEEIRNCLYQAQRCVENAEKEFFKDFADQIAKAREFINDAEKLLAERDEVARLQND